MKTLMRCSSFDGRNELGGVSMVVFVDAAFACVMFRVVTTDTTGIGSSVCVEVERCCKSSLTDGSTGNRDRQSATQFALPLTCSITNV